MLDAPGTLSDGCLGQNLNRRPRALTVKVPVRLIQTWLRESFNLG